jgi:hypothetical protein
VNSFIDLISKGQLDVQSDILLVPGKLRVPFVSPHFVGPDKQNRLAILRIFSSETNQSLDQTTMGFELMASERPFHDRNLYRQRSGNRRWLKCRRLLSP